MNWEKVGRKSSFSYNFDQFMFTLKKGKKLYILPRREGKRNLSPKNYQGEN